MVLFAREHWSERSEACCVPREDASVRARVPCGMGVDARGWARLPRGDVGREQAGSGEVMRSLLAKVTEEVLELELNG